MSKLVRKNFTVDGNDILLLEKEKEDTGISVSLRIRLLIKEYLKNSEG